MKTEKKQEVRSFGILSLACVLGAAFLVSAPLWNGKLNESEERTLRRAESLAYQVMEGQKSSSRGPASASETSLNHLALDQGEIGQDAWGRPYSFKLLKLKNAKASRLFVWSLGENGKSETSNSDLESNLEKSSPEFRGDDLGIMISVK